MKVSSWQDIIISWANALRLQEEPIVDVLDLVKGPFFVKLLNKTKNVEGNGDLSFSEDDVYNAIEIFLKDEYNGFRLLGYWDNDEVTLVSSVLLLWSSLESQSCRTPLYELEDVVQMKIQAFIQRFINTPQHLVNRQLVMDAVLDITFECGSEEESFQLSSSPRTSTPNRTPSSLSYSPACLALSEVRSLRSKVDLLNCEKQHLQEELEVTKSLLHDTKCKVQQKEMELMRLSNQIACGDFNENKSGSKSNSDEFSKNSLCESSLVKLELEDLRDIVNKLRQDLDSTIDENNNLTKKLIEEKEGRLQAEQKCDVIEAKNVRLTEKVDELETLIASLKKMCEEQSLFLAEKLKPADEESFRLSECETLEGVMDIKYSELKEELKVQTELLEEKTKEFNDLLLAKATVEAIVNSLKEENKTIKLELANNRAEVINCFECTILNDKLSSLQLKFKDKNEECKKFKDELAQNANQFKSFVDCKTSDGKKIADLQKDKIEMNARIEELKEKNISLQCDLNEKNKALNFYRDEINFLNNCLASKTVELNSLESGYTELSLSKDREISQLLKNIEHLHKEVRILQEQLHREFSSRDKPCYSANEWRLKLSQGLVTSNEEIAQELIALHESLQWKTLKIADLSLQVEQLKCEIEDKESINKELQERIIFLSEKHKEISKELQTSNNSLAHFQSKITLLEYNENRFSQEISRKNQKFEIVDFELKELWKLLKQKFHTIDLEMDTCMLRGKPDLQDIVKFIDFMCEKMKENKKNISHLTIAINELEADNAEKTAELEMFENKLGKLISTYGNSVIEQWLNENTYVHDRLRKIEMDCENNRIKLKDTLNELDNANENLDSKDKIITDLQSQVDHLNRDLKEKVQLIECLQQNVNLYEHEKSILEKKLLNLSHQSSRTDCGHVQNDSSHSEKDQEVEDYLKSEQISLGFQEKLLDLQTKMRKQYEEELNGVVEDYTKKIDQLKGKVKKDCTHIERLSSELWETSDRLLLAQQEVDALRSQLKRTQALMNEQNNRGSEDCNSFMWLGGLEAGNYVEEFVTTVSSKRKLQGQIATKASNDCIEDEDEVFCQQYLDDLKAGICRLPSSIERLSCPAESTRLDDDSGGTFLAPSGKPRKLKGSIMYRKPGPPTPSINAARHSLPGNELRKGLRERNSNISGGRSRLSQLFNSIHLTKPKTVQDSPTPKTKRKGFFQRTFGNRENLPPK